MPFNNTGENRKKIAKNRENKQSETCVILCISVLFCRICCRIGKTRKWHLGKNVQIEAIYIKLELEGWLTFDGGNSDRKENISNSERLTSVITKS